jgi:hypothetical protein
MYTSCVCGASYSFKDIFDHNYKKNCVGFQQSIVSFSQFNAFSTGLVVYQPILVVFDQVLRSFS